jgi:hypothetical protein
MVPPRQYPATYDGHPLARAAIAAPGNPHALCLPCACQDEGAGRRVRDAAARGGKRLGMGTPCVRFREAR